MTLNGIDVSTWQPSNITEIVNYDFAIMKASEGSMVAKNCNAQVSHAKKRNKLFGLYHFAVPGSPRAQADFFVETIKGYVGEGIPVLDLEGSGLTAWGGGGAFEFMDRVRDLTGIAPLFYSFGSALSGQDMRQLVEANFGLWTAHWNNRTTGGFSTPPRPMTGVWPFAAIHQYTDRGHLSGYSGDLDLNIFHGDADTWRAYATGGEEDMPLSSEDVKRVARAVHTYESSVNGLKFGDMLRVVYNSVRVGKKGVRHHGELTQEVLSRLNRIEAQSAASTEALKALTDAQGLDGDEILATVREAAERGVAEAASDMSITLEVADDEGTEGAEA